MSEIVPMLPGLVAIALALLTYADAKKLGVKPRTLPGLLRWGPGGWALVALLLNVIGIPLYAFYARPRLIAALRGHPDTAGLPPPSRVFPVSAGVGLILMLVAASAAGKEAERRRLAEEARWRAAQQSEPACRRTCQSLNKYSPTTERETQLHAARQEGFKGCVEAVCGLGDAERDPVYIACVARTASSCWPARDEACVQRCRSLHY